MHGQPTTQTPKKPLSIFRQSRGIFFYNPIFFQLWEILLKKSKMFLRFRTFCFGEPRHEKNYKPCKHVLQTFPLVLNFIHRFGGIGYFLISNIQKDVVLIILI
jgi:hypothetical protein